MKTPCASCHSSFLRHLLNILTCDYKRCYECNLSFCSPDYMIHCRDIHDNSLPITQYIFSKV